MKQCMNPKETSHLISSQFTMQLISHCCNFCIRYHDRSPEDIIGNPSATLPSSTPQMIIDLFGLGGWSFRVLWYTGLEAVLESSGNALHVTHASGTSCLPTLGLLTPVVCLRVSQCVLLPLAFDMAKFLLQRSSVTYIA